MIKLFFTDVDDTLLRENISKETKEAIKIANNNGLQLILCSGRPTNNLLLLAKDLNEYGCDIRYVCGFNGSEIVDVNANKTISEIGFTQSEISEITTFLNANEIDYGLYRDFTLYTNNMLNEYANLEATQCYFSIEEHREEMSSVKVLGFTDPSITREKIDLLKSAFPKLQINMSKPFFIEITKPGANKGLPVSVLSERLNIGFEECAVCGDGDNDIAMFELEVGAKYVVANGSDNLKKLATKVIASVDDNGVGRELLELIV